MSEPQLTTPPTFLRIVAAWSVHFYTATGLICAAGIAVLLTGDHPGPDQYRWAFILMFLATIIDATDGTLARRVEVKRIAPGFDGRRLDDLTDFLTYTSLPLYLIGRAGLLPAGQAAWLVVALLASAYGFCQVCIKTEDGYFRGFPSYWNLVAFYLYFLLLPQWANFGIVLLLAALTFVPSKYFYPTQRGNINHLMLTLASLWAFLIMWILIKIPGDTFPDQTPPEHSVHSLIVISLVYPLFYMLFSWFVSFREWWKNTAVPGRLKQPD
jgi:phosphatidylcholine synthase